MTPIIMTFGKYQGEALEDVPPGYLIWVYENIDHLQTDIAEWIEDNLDELKILADSENRMERGFGGKGKKRR